MAFLLYERLSEHGAFTLRPTGENFRLAGYNLIFRAWEKRGRPMNEGWNVSASELIALQTDESHTYETRRLIIDFHPSASDRICFIELLGIYAYTYEAASGGTAEWTPMMFRLRDVLYKEYDHNITSEEKRTVVSNLAEPHASEEFLEFLYLTGPAWNWGKNGSTNAVFLQKPVRDYFRPFF
jgi:hypothetical protein